MSVIILLRPHPNDPSYGWSQKRPTRVWLVPNFLKVVCVSRKGMFTPLNRVSFYEDELKKARGNRLKDSVPTKTEAPARKAASPVKLIHLKKRYFPIDTDIPDKRSIQYQNPKDGIPAHHRMHTIASKLQTGLEDYENYSKKKWIQVLQASEFVQGYPNKERCTIERSHFIQEHALRPEKLRALLLDTNAETLDLRGYLVGFNLSHLLYGTIRFSTMLRSVDISCNSLTCNAIIPLAKAFHGNRSVKYLNLSGNFLHAEGVKVISTMIRNNSYLVRLNLADCRMTDFGKNFEGIVALRIALEGHTALKHLDVSDNMLGQKGVLSITEVLSENYSIDTIDFSRNNYSEQRCRDTDLPGKLEVSLTNAANSILKTRSRMKVDPEGSLELIFNENITKMNMDMVRKKCKNIFAARVHRMEEIEAFLSGRFRIPEKVKEPSPEKPPKSDAWSLMGQLPPSLRDRVREKLVGTVDCVLPFEPKLESSNLVGEADA